jgi:hypothetical protein
MRKLILQIMEVLIIKQFFSTTTYCFQTQ